MARFAYVWESFIRFVTVPGTLTRPHRDLVTGAFCVAVVLLTLRQWLVPLAPPWHLLVAVLSVAFAIYVQPVPGFLFSHQEYKPEVALQRIRQITEWIGDPRIALPVLAVSLASLYFAPASAGAAWSVESIDNVCDRNVYQIARWSKEDDFFKHDSVLGHQQHERRIAKGCVDDHPFLTDPGYFRVSVYAGAGSIAIGSSSWKVGYPINTLDVVVTDDVLGSNAWHFADVAYSSHFAKANPRSIPGWELADTISFSAQGARGGEIVFTLGYRNGPSVPPASSATIRVFINGSEVFRNERPLFGDSTT